MEPILNKQPKFIGIAGATGYTGEELLRILKRHPYLSVEFVTSENEAGTALHDYYPDLQGYAGYRFIALEETVNFKVDLVFLCLPHGQSAQWARPFIQQNAKIVDLGADYRFDTPEEYKKWYDLDHPEPDLLSESVYGLPEWNREVIKTARIVGNPGCYPTSVLLGLLPLLKEKLITGNSVVVDSKSGVSGAGKSPSKTTHYVQVNENLTAYKAGRAHRHVGEMEQEIAKYSDFSLKVVFIPHLVPLTRGLYSTVTFQIHKDVTAQQMRDVLHQAYDAEPFVHVMDTILPGIKMATSSNHCFLAADVVEETRTGIVFSAIDNLGKGAAWQAVQNMNLMLGFPEETGLNA
ncbi:N-acetyl-gamma-glutamyl-phosphate reductase [candidate division KSB1 bacterium]|nr:N-acetyl-gamma-glutamyl-phosphate reductase [candidate division KSB1 bacterium]